MDGLFPDCPITGTAHLVPITSWLQMHAERKVTGVDYDLFWDDALSDGVAYFFSWRAKPRATVLVVWEGRMLSHIECRKACDELVPEAEALPILTDVVHAFSAAGFGAGRYLARVSDSAPG